jgi:hypothetical protein
VGARQKLNSAAIMGSLLLAGFLGVVTNSWIVFIIAAVIMLGLSLHSGDIRPSKRGR